MTRTTGRKKGRYTRTCWEVQYRTEPSDPSEPPMVGHCWAYCEEHALALFTDPEQGWVAVSAKKASD